jgi:uncharacterized protein
MTKARSETTENPDSSNQTKDSQTKLSPMIRRVSVLLFLSAVIAFFFSPANIPVAELLLFPCVDPRTPNTDSEFEAVRKLNIRVKEVTFPSLNGRILHGIFYEIPNTKRVFLFSHTKGNDIYLQLHKLRLFVGCGGSVFIYDYQGFGRSQGRATINGTCEDAVAAYDYLKTHEHRSPEDIVAIGESWGTGVTGQLITKRPVAAVIMHSGFSSLPSAARRTLFWLNLYPDWCFPERLDNTVVFSKPHPPLLIVHGRTDWVISVKEAERLYEKAIEPKSILILPKGHCTYGDGFEFAAAVRKFLDTAQQAKQRSTNQESIGQ